MSHIGFMCRRVAQDTAYFACSIDTLVDEATRQASRVLCGQDCRRLSPDPQRERSSRQTLFPYPNPLLPCPSPYPIPRPPHS